MHEATKKNVRGIQRVCQRAEPNPTIAKFSQSKMFVATKWSCIEGFAILYTYIFMHNSILLA